MVFIAGFLLDGKKCRRIYGHKYQPHFCVYAVDIILCILILGLLGSQAFMVKLMLILLPLSITCDNSGILVSSG